MEGGVGDHFKEKESQFIECAELLKHTSAPEVVDEVPSRSWWESWRTWLFR
jgi:hypothetical protein